MTGPLDPRTDPVDETTGGAVPPIEAAAAEPGAAGTAPANVPALDSDPGEAGPAQPIVVPEVPSEPATAVAEAIVAEPATTPGAMVAVPPVEAAPADAVLVPLEDIAPAIQQASLTRRAFIGFGMAVVVGAAGAAALGRLFPVFASAGDEAGPLVPGYDPATKAWTFVVDTSTCIGCGLCVLACKEENNVPQVAEFTRTWVERHVTTTDGTLYVDSPDSGINGFPAGSTAPGAAGKAVESSFFQPRLCMQCEDSPCTAVCPVSATYRTEDGIILVDSRRCIGCGYCVVACPYGARYLVPAGENAPNDTPGVADKCNWCYQRISRGRQPACVEICPVGARRFGDANDPASGMATFVAEHDPQPLHPEYGTKPRVLYLGPTLKEA